MVSRKNNDLILLPFLSHVNIPLPHSFILKQFGLICRASKCGCCSWEWEERWNCTVSLLCFPHPLKNLSEHQLWDCCKRYRPSLAQGVGQGRQWESWCEPRSDPQGHVHQFWCSRRFCNRQWVTCLTCMTLGLKMLINGPTTTFMLLWLEMHMI